MSISIERLSPSIVVLRFPQELVLEVATTGSFDHIEWRRNGDLSGHGGFFPHFSQFPHFREMYVKEPTITANLGVYEASLQHSLSGQTGVESVEFTVVTLGN